MKVRDEPRRPRVLLDRRSRRLVKKHLSNKKKRKGHVVGNVEDRAPDASGPAPWRPDAQQIQHIEYLAGTGLSQAEIADVIGVSLSTLSRRKAEMDTLDAAIKKGRSRGKTLVVNTLFKMATEDKNLGAVCFYLKNHGWSDRVDNAIFTPKGEAITTRLELTPEQRAARLTQILNAARTRRAGSTDSSGPDED